MTVTKFITLYFITHYCQLYHTLLSTLSHQKEKNIFKKRKKDLIFNINCVIFDNVTIGEQNETYISVMTILEPGQKLIIWSNGRRCDDVKIWAWDGSTLNISDMRNSEYEAKKDFMLIDKGEII